MGVGEAAPGLVFEGLLGCAVAPVRVDEEGGWRGEFGGDVEVEGDVGWVGAEVLGYLLEGGGAGEGGDEEEGEAGEEREHFAGVEGLVGDV